MISGMYCEFLVAVIAVLLGMWEKYTFILDQKLVNELAIFFWGGGVLFEYICVVHILKQPGIAGERCSLSCDGKKQKTPMSG